MTQFPTNIAYGGVQPKQLSMAKVISNSDNRKVHQSTGHKSFRIQERPPRPDISLRLTHKHISVIACAGRKSKRPSNTMRNVPTTLWRPSTDMDVSLQKIYWLENLLVCKALPTLPGQADEERLPEPEKVGRLGTDSESVLMYMQPTNLSVRSDTSRRPSLMSASA